MIGFSGNMPSIENEKRRAKLYSQIYQYAAEDFTNYQNMHQWITGLYAYLNMLELKIQRLTAILQKHTHIITPHIHPIAPHIHISTRPGDPTTPNIGAQTTLVNAPLDTAIPTQAPTIVWLKAPMPMRILNTTGAITNMVNIISLSPGSTLEAEESGPHRVRANPPRILLIPSIPTFISQGVRSGLT